VSTFRFRSTAELVADGTVRRPAYLDVDSPFAEPSDALGAPRRVFEVRRAPAEVAPDSPVAVTTGETGSRGHQRTRHPDRIGRLLH
jgi:hypothetical protein